MIQTIKGQPINELESTILGLGHSSYRAKQLFRWLYQRKLNHFDEMTDLSKDFREELKTKYSLPKLVIKEKRESEDGTVKYLVGLPDGHQVESVFIPQEGRNTLCVSTQVGCKMACSFCATGYMKFSRNLQAWEIVEQLIGLEFPAPVTNVVMMGMGEPFDNYEEVIKALKIMQDPMGPKIGKRHITVSTVGLVPKIQEFMDANLGKLAISLHGTTDEQRSQIMPINKKYPLAELMETCRTLTLKGRTRVTFEYVLLKDLNDSEEDAHRLAKLVKEIPCKINLLAYNENQFINLKRPPEERVLKFQRILLDYNLTATYRRSRGRDIGGACGQLHAENKKKKTSELN